MGQSRAHREEGRYVINVTLQRQCKVSVVSVWSVYGQCRVSAESVYG